MGEKKLDETTLKRTGGKMIYLTNFENSNILFAIGVVCCYIASPREFHLNVVKYIFKYFKGTIDFGIIY
jgi:hypothetical protein